MPLLRSMTDQDRQPHRVVVNSIEQALDSELADVGVPVRTSRDVALLGGDALVGVDLFRLALDHARQGRQADMAGTYSGQRNVLGARPFAIAPLDLGDDLRATSVSGQGGRFSQRAS